MKFDYKALIRVMKKSYKGGGIKIIRAMILYKQVYRELLRAMHPSAIWPVRSLRL